MRRNRAPTRVNNACDRCRRQKQRCDDVRPCENCLHSRSECVTSETPPISKKPRISKKTDSQQDSTSPAVKNFAAIKPVPPPPPPEVQRESSIHYASTTPQSEHTSMPPTAQRDPTSNVRHDSTRDKLVLANLHGSESAMDITKKILGYAQSPSATDRATFAIPGGDSNRTQGLNATYGKLLPIEQIIGIDLPSREVSDALIDTYFSTVHWFSLVLYEPKFRDRYTAIIDRRMVYPSDRAFLLLLLMVMIMACWYGPGLLPEETASAAELATIRNSFLKVVSSSFMDLIDEDCLEFVQLSELLGSYWLYWGRPRSSFSILGAATKSAQAIELHRDKDKYLSSQDAEERKRVWWTIYTWDRFATIIYGRPLGINDKDCNVSMPASFSENISFTAGDEPARVCLSPYQIQLNRIYQITSPLLEDIYGIRYSTDRSLRSQMPAMVAKIDQLMQAWQDDLPPHLCLDKHDDITLVSSAEEKIHRLQALSLQLTYDNLMIVIHRPLLADQSYRSRRRSTNASHLVTSNESSGRPLPTSSNHQNSFRKCLNSALRISRVQQNKRNLVALARRTHLVSFLGMNLFTSSIVMFICALSDTLSDVAQEAKRGMARNLKMLKLLSGDGSLSMQCSTILEDLVQKIIDKEKEEMLHSMPSDDEVAPIVPTRKNSYVDGRPGIIGVGTGSHVTWHTTDELEKVHEGMNDSQGHDGVFTIQQTMASLQKVFKDVATPRPQFTAPGFEPQQANPQLSQYGQMQSNQQLGTNNGFVFDGSNFNTEDLGQFWLWNMDPHMEDASWQSGDEYM